METHNAKGVPYRCRFCHKVVVSDFNEKHGLQFFELDKTTMHSCQEKYNWYKQRSFNSAETRRRIR